MRLASGNFAFFSMGVSHFEETFKLNAIQQSLLKSGKK